MTDLVKRDAVMAKLTSAARLLAEVRDASDAKKVVDVARAVEDYARRQKVSEEVIAHATAVRVDAMTLLGEFLKAAEKNKGTALSGRNVGGSHRELPKDDAPTLAECGISKKESMLAQRLVDVREKFPDVYERVRAGRVSVSKAVAAVKRKDAVAPQPPADDDPCWLVKKLDALAAGRQRFGTIYADPPWQYGNQATRAATDNHYPTMTLEEIAALPVGDLAAEKSHLHLWTTDSFLEPAIELLKGWGFERRQTFVWVKPQLGIGNYWRSSHEYMLLGIRGGLTFPASNVMSWGQWDRQEHSAKPEAVRRLIERMSPGPRLELFARKTSPGWKCWGNQIEGGLLDGPVFVEPEAGDGGEVPSLFETGEAA